MRLIRVLLSIPIIAGLLFISPSARASEVAAASMQNHIDEVIEEYGGMQTAWNEVSWDEGNLILTINSTLTDPVCGSGRYCVYSRTSYKGFQLSFSTCPATNTSFDAIGPVRSIKNNRTSGIVRAYSGSTLKSTISAGNGSANVSGITKVTCS